MANVFIAHTPYNILASESIATNTQKNILFLSPSFKNSEVIYECLDEYNSNFDNVIKLPRRHVGEQAYGIFTPTIRVMKAIFDLVGVDIEHLYFCKDISPVAQAAKFVSGQNTKCSWIIDGTSAYISKPKQYSDIKTVIKHKFRYGPWYQYSYPIGSTGIFDEVYSPYPSLLREDLLTKEKEKIPLRMFKDIKNSRWVGEHLSAVGFDAQSLSDIDVLITLEHSNWAKKREGYVDLIEDIIEEFSRDIDIGIKYHPRENIEYIDTSQDKITLIPREYPSEYIYIFNNSLEYVVGGVSTSLITAQWLLDDTTTISYMLEMGEEYSHLRKVFEEIGIGFYTQTESI